MSEQKPVAWRSPNASPPGGFVTFQQYPQALAELGGVIEPLYTHPPIERTLTDEVIADLWHQTVGFPHHFARAVERYLKGEE